MNIFWADERFLLPYIIHSLLFFTILLCILLSCRTFLTKKNDPTKQLIDIELISSSDFQDKQEILPANKPEVALQKRKTNIDAWQKITDTVPRYVVRQASSPAIAQNIEERAVKSNGILNLTGKEIITSMPSSVSEVKAAVNSSVKSISQGSIKVQRDADLTVEEVKPIEMMEIKENDGEESGAIWQNGGRSTQGNGATSSLSDYLKQLHHKLKRCWVPPSNSVRNIKVLFRLAKDGSLVSVDLAKSSGDHEADLSALTAIKAAAPFGNLPRDYPYRCLDLIYTFSFTADELEEASR